MHCTSHDRPRHARVVVALVGLVLLGQACSGGDDDKSPGSAATTTLPRSAVQGLSIFPRAVADPAAGTTGREVYRVPVAAENVVLFYRNGNGYGSTDTAARLVKCSEKLTSPYELSWRVGESNDFVVVQVAPDPPAADGKPQSILTIAEETANPTRTCDLAGMEE